MKKLFLLALVAAMAAPAIQANIQTDIKVMGNKAKPGTCREVVGVVNSTPAPQVIKNPNHAPEAGYAEVTLAAGDVWGDGSGYQMLLDADATAYGTIIPETGGLTTTGDASAEVYAEFEYKIPENADGALATTNIVMNGSVTIQIPAGVYDFCITNPTAGDRMWIASQNGSIGGRADDFEFVSGGTYVFTVSLGGQNDQVDLEAIIPGMPTLPTELTVEPAATYADVAWVPGENNDTWNLRYRPYVDPATQGRLWDLPIPGYEEQIEGFTIYDADGDGYNWGLAYSSDAQDDACFYSYSYTSETGTYEALTPDNWLYTPEVPMGGTLKFKTWNRSSTYADKIAVYVVTEDSEIKLGEDITPGTTPEEVELDLSEFEGTAQIAFRHYDCEDLWAIYVDDIEVTNPDAPEIQEWIEVEDVVSPFTIDELTPETTYEVQVKAFGPVEAETLNAAGGPSTEWTESTLFTTLAEDPLVGVETVKVETTGDNNYYNLMGQKVTGNLPAGIYIHNGKKIVVR